MTAEMSKEIISSRSNKVIKYLKSLGLGRNRQKEGRFLIEGVRMVEEAIDLHGCVLKVIVTPQGMQNQRATYIVSAAREKGVEVLWVADRVIDYISETKTNQGVMALVQPKEFSEDDLEKGSVPVIVVAHLLQDPGNLGTIVRVAEAAGIGGVVTTPGTVDFYNPKALRATMGSIFRLPNIRVDSLEGFVERFRAKGYQVAAAMVSAKVRYFDLDYGKPTIILLGQEGAGLPAEASALADRQITIPMATMMDSMNVSSAASVILYEAVRQRLVRVGGPGQK
ncbi:MAG: RNA methyltransferase [Nitrospirae bacterium]|nr:RNA methyltransferase [Nitrospirota bacterium]MBI5694441.1 RNA methyltransferase [Nitrospirota bacterium]